jgi:hypothetical protein
MIDPDIGDGRIVEERCQRTVSPQIFGELGDPFPHVIGSEPYLAGE